MKTLFPLNHQGYVTAWLATEPALSDFIAPHTDPDQLRFERDMRSICYREPTGYPVSGLPGEMSPIGKPWIFYAKNRDPYLDFSTFYFTLQDVVFLARTTVVSDRAREASVRIYSYAAFDLYLNGTHAARETVPVYQPIRHTDLTLSLREGENDLFLVIRNFGVRDTRNMLSVQFRDAEGLSTTLPIPEPQLARLSAAEAWFCSLVSRDGLAVADGAPPVPISVKNGGNPLPSWTTGETYPLGDAPAVTFTATVEGAVFSRRLELPFALAPHYRRRGGISGLTENAVRAVERATEEIGGEIVLRSGTGDHYLPYVALSRVLASGGKVTPLVEECVRRALVKVRERIDCADFALSAILRMVFQLTLSPALLDEIRETALGFRYWMDEEGADAMCFWSENHSLLFHGCQMLAGKLWPTEIFLRSHRSGYAQYLEGYRRVSEWFDVVEEEGFEEFCSGGYMGVTTAAVLMIHDFGGERLRPRAKRVLDRIVREAATQCFAGIHISPMGRIYRTALTPYRSSLQALLHILDDRAADGVDAWYSTLGFSDYRFPEGLERLMWGELETVFDSGSASIETKKTGEYLLTSVASPRITPPAPSAHTDTEYYRTKIMNEGFHGTTLFEPGKGGYQQHLFYAALSDRFYTFVNLPGSERDFCSMRPGYWYGNLVFPEIRRRGRALTCRYLIPDAAPTKFTHAYFPAASAEEVMERDGFRFARVGEGYLALGCSVELLPWDRDAVQGAELRAYGEDVTWYVRVGRRSEDGSFAEFAEETLRYFRS